MSKIICDVCGTRYPESADQCPICGCARAGGGKTVADDIVMDEAMPVASAPRTKGGRFSKSNVRKRARSMPSYDEVEEKPRAKTAPRQEPDDAYDAYDFNERPRKQKSNLVLNIMLVTVIIALLCVTAYIFTEYFLPGILAQQEETIAPTETTAITEAPPTEPEITEEPTIPCTTLEWVDEAEPVVLEALGNSWLLNVVVGPEDTTDELVYTSSDESVVTVDGEGRIVAVGEGEAIVTVTCGSMQLECSVSCVFATESPATEGETTPDGETVPEGETTEATEAPAEPTAPLKDVTLKVNYTDITLTGHGQQFTFKVTDLTNEEVTWTSDDESVVTVENGTVTRVGKGTANITVTYGEQEVVIIVRCR